MPGKPRVAMSLRRLLADICQWRFSTCAQRDSWGGEAESGPSCWADGSEAGQLEHLRPNNYNVSGIARPAIAWHTLRALSCAQPASPPLPNGHPDASWLCGSGVARASSSHGETPQLPSARRPARQVRPALVEDRLPVQPIASHAH
jgi:hypothetical protein